MSEESEELRRFARGDIDAASFTHREHVRMAFEMLRRHDFVETALHFSHAVRIMAARAGHAQVFHQTITIAFLSLIAERMELGRQLDFESFALANPDVFEKNVLNRWYCPERLSTKAARQTFLLPDASS
jgi:hypothetical protein